MTQLHSCMGRDVGDNYGQMFWSAFYVLNTVLSVLQVLVYLLLH